MTLFEFFLFILICVGSCLTLVSLVFIVDAFSYPVGRSWLFHDYYPWLLLVGGLALIIVPLILAP